MSILLYYVRTFALAHSRMRIAVYISMAYVTLWSLLVIMVPPLTWYSPSEIDRHHFRAPTLTQRAGSRPTSYYWTRFDPQHPTSGTCLQHNVAGPIASGALNIIADIGVLVLPIFVLGRLQLSRRKRIAVISVFCVGIL